MSTDDTPAVISMKHSNIKEAIRTDVQLAKDHRLIIQTLLMSVTDAMNSCVKDGFTPSINIGMDQYGRWFIQSITIVKPLA